MAPLSIVTYPEKILRGRAQEVSEVTPEIKQLIPQMAKTMVMAEGVGLAAPQVGVLKRVIIVETGRRYKKLRAFLNPRITEKSREMSVLQEGCLSLPHVWLPVKRAERIQVICQILSGKEVTIEASGLSARIFQHEIDHLNGKLIIDYGSALEKCKEYLKQKWRVLIVFFACILFLLGVIGLVISLFIPIDRKNSEQVLFRVERGEGSWQIVSRLQEEGLIRSRMSFLLYALISGRAFGLQQGEYLVSPSLSANQILNKLAVGDIIQEQITIKEGWNLRDIAQEFERRGFFTGEELFALTGYPGVDYRQETSTPSPKDFSDEFPLLRDKPSYVSLEGYLFPDTYILSAIEKPEGFVYRALQNFESKLTPDMLGKIERQGKTLFEVLTWAAMLEKEVRTFEDKQLVMGVLQKRMEQGIPLQTDATVVYIREGESSKVSIEETQIESPYNTYRVYGLPLGPISNPGLDSIRAVLEPKESPYWYYLSARDGTTIFSRTFEEHKIAKAKYLR